MMKHPAVRRVARRRREGLQNDAAKAWARVRGTAEVSDAMGVLPLTSGPSAIR